MATVYLSELHPHFACHCALLQAPPKKLLVNYGIYGHCGLSVQTNGQHEPAKHHPDEQGPDNHQGPKAQASETQQAQVTQGPAAEQTCGTPGPASTGRNIIIFTKSSPLKVTDRPAQVLNAWSMCNQAPFVLFSFVCDS